MTSDWPQQLSPLANGGGAAIVTIDDKDLRAAISLPAPLAVLELDELRDLHVVLGAALSELRKIRQSRENAKIAAQNLVNQLGSIDAAKAAIAELEAAA